MSLSPVRTAGVKHFEVVIVGAGAGGIATAASILRRQPQLRVALIDPADTHYYQPGWTMVGGGIFTPQSTARPMAKVIPSGTQWLKQAVAGFSPEQCEVHLDDGSRVQYDRLVVAAGLKLNWQGVEGLAENLGRNGVTSNYSINTCAYTWELVQGLRRGRALFTQPPMPIKCAGAPQKALYLSGDAWRRRGVLDDIDIEFCTATPGLFGVAAYVPALMEYVERYNATLSFQHTLIKIDGENRVATFKTAEGATTTREFDMIHVCPPQCAPDFIAQSPLADASGWVDVNPDTLQHQRFENIWAVGDCMNTSNAKTAAAARAQAPTVAVNLLHHLGLEPHHAHYNGYGSCPLTVERGKVVLAEFAYGGRVVPSFPKFLINGERPSRLAWLLKARLLPWIYWHAMLKGREWMAKPLHQV